jgi:hypothetical protein
MVENHEEAGSVRPEVAQAVGIAANATPDHAADLAAFLSVTGTPKHGRAAAARDGLCTAEADRKESNFVGI